jgi:hypothetical protein
MQTKRQGPAAVAFLLALLACGGDSTGPKNHVPALGAYSYYFKGLGVPAQGQFVITSANADSLEGYFDVPKMNRKMDLGEWNVDAYVVYATGVHSGAPAGIAATRLSFSGKNGETVSCVGIAIDNAGGGNASSTPSDCTLTFLGPPGPETTIEGNWDGVLSVNGVADSVGLAMDRNGSQITATMFLPAPIYDFDGTGTYNPPELSLSFTSTTYQPFMLQGVRQAHSLSTTLNGSGFVNTPVTFLRR